MIRVKVSTAVHPTEDPEKVERSILALFTGIYIEKKSIEASETDPGDSSSFLFSGEGGVDLLLTLHRLIRKEKIIDSIRDKVFNKGLSNDNLSIRFLLNKQVAFVGIPSIPVQEEPLGSIEVIISADSPEEMERLIEWLLPVTENGIPVNEIGTEYVTDLCSN